MGGWGPSDRWDSVRGLTGFAVSVGDWGLVLGCGRTFGDQTDLGEVGIAVNGSPFTVVSGDVDVRLGLGAVTFRPTSWGRSVFCLF